MRRILAIFLFTVGCNATSPPLGLHQPGRMQGAIDIGPVDGNQPIDLVLVLKHPARSVMNERPSRALSPTEIADLVGPSADDYRAIVGWLRGGGLEITRTTPSRTTLTVRGSAAQIEDSFATRLRRYRDRRGEFRAPAVEPSFGALTRFVVSAVGLDDAARWRPKLQAPPPDPRNHNGDGLEPAELKKLYAIDQVAEKGEGQTVAILGTGFAPNPTTDVDRFITRYMLPTKRAAQYTIIELGAGNRDPDSLADLEQGENILDIDMVLGLAPMANVVHVHTATNTPGLFTDGITYIINQVPQAHAVSVSYGTCERYAASEYLAMNHLFAQAKAQGQSWFFASGDDGTDTCKDGDPTGVLTVDWPSSSPYVLGVGGTQLDRSGKEIVWPGSGGGQSELVDKPAYQIGVAPLADSGVRHVPDVAAIAGSPGVAVVFGNFVSPSGGTSAAAPMWAAVWAILHQAKGFQSGITNAHEEIYRLKGRGLNDITVGANDGGATAGFPALPGYDLATGWGTPNMPALISVWGQP